MISNLHFTQKYFNLNNFELKIKEGNLFLKFSTIFFKDGEKLKILTKQHSGVHNITSQKL